MIVVDASLGVKWFLDEVESVAADTLLVEYMGKITVPDIFLIEVASALVRTANMHKTTQLLMQEHLGNLATLWAGTAFTQVHMESHQLKDAADIAIELGHPLKDCIYLALAMEHDCELITCDARFAVRAKTIWPTIKLLTDVH
jgi:predicted nucleic acid-binding protein